MEDDSVISILNLIRGNNVAMLLFTLHFLGIEYYQLKDCYEKIGKQEKTDEGSILSKLGNALYDYFDGNNIRDTIMALL